MITIERISTEGTAHRVSIGTHEITVDMSPPTGGDEGPDPHDLYDAALGACKALTMLWVAKRENIPVEGIKVGVSRDASEERSGLYRLTARLAIDGPLSDEQHDRLIAASGKCPVQKLMTSVKTEVETIVVRLPEGRSCDLV
ncbi:MAG: OsmC family peroxiredoxin [Sphingobium sp.]|nr:OsmC family peroxiredoxin [Sphingobium sp.]